MHEKMSELAEKMNWNSQDVKQFIEEVYDLLEQQKNKPQDLCNEQSISMDERITKILTELGMTFNIKGFNYARYAIKLVTEDHKILENMTQKLYPMVAEEFNTTFSNVERGIRYAIMKTWDYGNVEACCKYFGWTISMGKGKPSNSEFIALLADYLQLKRDLK